MPSAARLSAVVDAITVTAPRRLRRERAVAGGVAGAVVTPAARRPFRWRTRTKGGWLLAGALAETLLVGALASTDRPYEGAAAAVAAHLLVGIGVVAGAKAERDLRAFSRLSIWRSARFPASLAAPLPLPPGGVGDPGLDRAVGRPRPPHARLRRVASHAALVRWQGEVRGRLRALHDFRPPAGRPTVERRHVEPLGDGVQRVTVLVERADGTRLPGFLFEHAPADRPRPGILVIPGHGPGIVSTAGLVDSYEHATALRLARAGYVVLTLELRGSGFLGERLGISHEAVATNALLAGTSFEAVVLGDLSAGLAVLGAHPDVDAARLGVTGCSLGGRLAIALAALCPSVRVLVAQGLADWPDADGRRPGLSGHGYLQTNDPCWVVPGENAHVWYEDRWLLVAPRPMLLVNADGDVGDMDRRGSWLVDRLRHAYAACGASDAFAFRVERGHHQYFVEPALRFFARHL